MRVALVSTQAKYGGMRKRVAFTATILCALATSTVWPLSGRHETRPIFAPPGTRLPYQMPTEATAAVLPGWVQTMSDELVSLAIAATGVAATTMVVGRTATASNSRHPRRGAALAGILAAATWPVSADPPLPNEVNEHALSRGMFQATFDVPDIGEGVSSAGASHAPPRVRKAFLSPCESAPLRSAVPSLPLVWTPCSPGSWLIPLPLALIHAVGTFLHWTAYFVKQGIEETSQARLFGGINVTRDPTGTWTVEQDALKALSPKKGCPADWCAQLGNLSTMLGEQGWTLYDASAVNFMLTPDRRQLVNVDGGLVPQHSYISSTYGALLRVLGRATRPVDCCPNCRVSLNRKGIDQVCSGE
jgi:hypothetical protein